ncbi:MAG: glycosyltransferase family 9 protein [Elusimicrobiota bacterium]|jgi:ADP-heptose:LPS heptosyltransferase|nr:glycosyltransferase family 9 protein [Elusimicrobiota bacterium]
MKVLIIKPSSFGDIICALACADALKRSYKNVSISWVVFKQWKDVLKLCPDIDEIISWDRLGGLKEFIRVVKFCRRTKFDYVFDLQGLLRTALLAKFIKAENKFGVSGMKEMSHILIEEIYPQNAKINATLRNLETIRFVTKQKFDPKINLRIPADIKEKADNILLQNGVKNNFIVLQPFARGKGKDWSVQNYKELIILLQKKYPHLDIVILSTAKDFGNFKDCGVFDLCGQTNILELAAILSKAKIAIGADTGSMHLACALNTPSVFIFGASNMIETSPYIGKFRLLVNKKNHRDINKISPQEVFCQAQEFIEQL